MKTIEDRSTALSDAQLAAELARLGVPFITFSYSDLPEPSPSPDTFLKALAQSNAARLRMALIPLLLAHIDYAESAAAAAASLSGPSRVTLVCYYTAALLLERKYAHYLAQQGLKYNCLPNLFGSELGLPQDGTPDALLTSLAHRHAQLSGRDLNWLGTYEHAAHAYFQQLENDPSWKTRQTQASSTPF